MAEAPVPDRPNVHINASHGLRSLVHADVLIQTMKGEGAARPLSCQPCGRVVLLNPPAIHTLEQHAAA